MPIAPDLQQFVTDDLKADPVAWPILDKMSEKDVPSVLKSYAHSQHRLGSALSLPGKDAKAEDVAALKQKLYDAGLFTAPPGAPKDYGITKPEKLSDGLGWNDELSTKFATTLHKHGAPKALAADLLTLYEEALLGAQTGLKTSYDEGIAALKVEHGDKFAERQEGGKRLASMIFKTADEVEFFERTGLADHPGFLNILMRLAPLAMQDSSFVREAGRPGGGMAGDEVRAEVAKIMTDKAHPMYEGYWRKDAKVMAHIDELYKKAYGTGTEIIGGITTEAAPAR